jgi:hypothetical protein
MSHRLMVTTASYLRMAIIKVGGKLGQSMTRDI